MSSTPSAAKKPPTVVIYQNADFVSGMLQELFEIGVLQSAEVDLSHKDASSEGKKRSGQGKAGIGANIPIVGKGEISLGGEHIKDQARSDETTTADRKKFVYSQTFYLDQVRSELRKRELIRPITEFSDAEKSAVGDIVEFSATFRANEVNAVLDIATPDLTAAVMRYLQRKSGTDEMRALDDYASVEQITRVRQISENEANDRADLASAITAAIRADFRGDRTKEFYGYIGHDIIAVTVCEADHFVTRDPDRLLDGQFTVLAKVISRMANDAPVLAKNKLLHRMNPNFLDHTLQTLSDASRNQIPDSLGDYEGSPFNIEFASTIKGHSITVMPIAIYI